MNWKKILGTAGQVAATAGATAINPALGGAVGTALLGGAAGNKAGDKIGHRLNKDLGKAGGPLGAVAGAVVGTQALGAAGLDSGQLCELARAVLEGLCGHPTATAGAVGLLSTLAYGLARQTQKAGRPKNG